MLKYYIQQLLERLDGLKWPIRLAIFVGVYLIISAVIYWLLVAAIVKQADHISKHIDSAQEQHTILEAKAKQYKNQTTQQQDAKLERLENKLSELQQQLDQYQNSLLAPKHLAIILKSMLQQEPNVSIKRLQRQSAERVKVKNKKGKQSKQSSVYRLTYSIQYQGDFESTLRYIKQLKQLPWHIFWNQMTYQVSRYPSADVELQIATLVDRGD